jgi:transcriptional regulator with XRE-family HTH domain
MTIWPLSIWSIVSTDRNAAGTRDTQSVTRWTDRPFVEELPDLLSQRQLSLTRLAQRIDLNPSHLSRVLRRANYKTPSAELTRKVALALDLPPDYFPEYREGLVIDRVKADATLRDELYVRLTR